MTASRLLLLVVEFHHSSISRQRFDYWHTTRTVSGIFWVCSKNEFENKNLPSSFYYSHQHRFKDDSKVKLLVATYCTTCTVYLIVPGTYLVLLYKLTKHKTFLFHICWLKRRGGRTKSKTKAITKH